MAIGPICFTYGEMLMARVERRVSRGTVFSTCRSGPRMNSDGQPMTSTSEKPRFCRYSAVTSPRTPTAGERCSTALTNRFTLAPIGSRRSRVRGVPARAPTPSTTTGMVSCSMRADSPSRCFWNEGRNAFASGMTKTSYSSLICAALLTSVLNWFDTTSLSCRDSRRCDALLNTRLPTLSPMVLRAYVSRADVGVKGSRRDRIRTLTTSPGASGAVAAGRDRGLLRGSGAGGGRAVAGGRIVPCDHGVVVLVQLGVQVHRPVLGAGLRAVAQRVHRVGEALRGAPGLGAEQLRRQQSAGGRVDVVGRAGGEAENLGRPSPSGPSTTAAPADGN